MSVDPMHEEKNPVKTQKYHLPRFGFIFKNVNSPLPLVNQSFSTFQIPLKPRCQRGSNGI